MDITLQVSAISKSYGPIQALKNVSFSVPRGSVFGILGPNGSGKSTLLGIMLQILQANNGTIQWVSKEGKPLSRNQLGAFLETPNFYHYMSGYNNLKITSAISGRGTIADIDAILDQLKLAHRKNSKFSTYSLGMKQRLAIAAALLGNPSILLLDEPTNGLDPEGIAEIRNLIQQLAAQGTTIIMASHLLDEVEKVCTHVAILKKGELLTSGSIRDLMSGEEIIHLDAADLTHLQEILQGYPGIASMKIEGDTLKVYAIGGAVQLDEINRYCFQQGIALRQLTLHKKSLETTFLELTH